MEKFKKTGLFDGSGSEWNEDEHPRDEDGKFTAKGAAKHSDSSTGAGEALNGGENKSSELSVDTTEARELYNRLSNGERLSYDELKNHPVVKYFESQCEEGKQAAKSKKPLTAEEIGKYAEQFLKNANTQRKEYRADIVMGLPSAGKSTAVVDRLKEQYGSFEFDNDEIKQLLDGYNEYGASFVHEDSKVVQKKAFEAFEQGGRLNGANLAIPIIGSTVKKVKDWIDDLRVAGYDVHVHHVGISNNESLNRSVQRAIKTGRYVPLDIIQKYGEKPAEVFEELKQSRKEEGVTYEQD